MTEQKKKKRNGLQWVLPLGYACANRKGALLFFFRFPFSSLRRTPPLLSPFISRKIKMLRSFFEYSFFFFLLVFFFSLFEIFLIVLVGGVGNCLPG